MQNYVKQAVARSNLMSGSTCMAVNPNSTVVVGLQEVLDAMLDPMTYPLIDGVLRARFARDIEGTQNDYHASKHPYRNWCRTRAAL